MTNLFSPLKIGDLTLNNRIIMAPLTRRRSGRTRVPNELMAQYYAQRASAGLIMTEATVVTPMGIGYAETPGIWSDAQVDGWKLTTRAVHEAGGRIFLQLWHVGRVSDPEFLGGARPVAPSAVAMKGHVSLLRPERAYGVPRPLEAAEIPDVIDAFRVGAENAQRAGFDGVELHGANGYLLDQFLQDSTNLRTDLYGGSLENRARVLLEATDAAILVWGPDRVGVHLAPRADAHDMGDADLARTFTYVAQQLGQRKIAFLCAREHVAPDSLGPRLKQAFGGTYIGNESYTFQSATQALQAGDVDAVAFGKLFIANPDLPRRFKTGAPLNPWNADTFYSFGPQGYVDYATLQAEAMSTST